MLILRKMLFFLLILLVCTVAPIANLPTLFTLPKGETIIAAIVKKLPQL